MSVNQAYSEENFQPNLFMEEHPEDLPAAPSNTPFPFVMPVDPHNSKVSHWNQIVIWACLPQFFVPLMMEALISSERILKYNLELF